MIKGEKVGLRAVEFTDLNKLQEWRNKPEFRQFFRENRELNWDQQKTWFTDKVNRDPNTRMFSIVSLANTHLIGACGLCYIDWVNGSADLSLYIGHNDLYIDKVYAPDTVETLVQYAFDEMRLHRLWTEVYSFDEKKQALFRSLGFQETIHRETYWKDGKWNDSVFFSLLNN